MKRLHLHSTVKDLDASIRFYSGLFGQAPTVRHDDYAKWMVEDPRINFAISTWGKKHGQVDHLGIQVDSEAELTALEGNLRAAALPLMAEKNTNCCYANSNKHWTMDPDGMAWEAYHTLAQIETRDGRAANGAPKPAEPERARACCG
jgi:catechol 2,3-dioxygenase-like lactoylglutathione lyase family enzyme